MKLHSMATDNMANQSANVLLVAVHSYNKSLQSSTGLANTVASEHTKEF